MWWKLIVYLGYGAQSLFNLHIHVDILRLFFLLLSSRLFGNARTRNQRRAHPLLRMSVEPIRRRGWGRRPHRRRCDRLRRRRRRRARHLNNSSRCRKIISRRCRWRPPPRQRWPTGRAHRLPAEEAHLRRLANPNLRISSTEKRRRQLKRRSTLCPSVHARAKCAPSSRSSCIISISFVWIWFLIWMATSETSMRISQQSLLHDRYLWVFV